MFASDLVVVGDEGVVENRGIFNTMVMYAMRIEARELGNPLYIATKSYKFASLFLMNQLDLTDMGPEAGLRFVDKAIWEVTWGGRGVGTRLLLRDWILLCELQRGAEQ